MVRQERRWTGFVLLGIALVANGCAVRFSKRSPWDVQQLQQLSEQLDQFKNLAQLKAEEAEQLRQAKALLEQRLASEIASKDISVGYDERGLVVRVLDQVLFDSGKSKLRPEAGPVLKKVARVLNQDLADQPIGVEGHTDNQPIKYSHWKDNYELSKARATSVMEYLDRQGVDPVRMTPSGHGDEKPIAPNDTPNGRRANRRVEIVVQPKVGEGGAPAGASTSRGESSYTK